MIKFSIIFLFLILFLILNISSSQQITQNHPTKVESSTTQILPAPVINSIYPNQGPKGIEFCLKGNFFGMAQGSRNLKIKRKITTLHYHLKVNKWTNTEIRAEVPHLRPFGYDHEFVICIVDQNNKRISNKIPVTARQKPHLLWVIPDEGPVGKEVTIVGLNWGDNNGDYDLYPWLVQYNGEKKKCQIISWTNTEIKVKIPFVSPGNYQFCFKQRANRPAVSNKVAFTVKPSKIFKKFPVSQAD